MDRKSDEGHCGRGRGAPSLYDAIGDLPVSTKPAAGSRLHDLDLRAHVLELLADRLGLFLVDAFLQRLGRALDEVLGFLQPEAGDLADDLDDLDLVRADLLEVDVE